MWIGVEFSLHKQVFLESITVVYHNFMTNGGCFGETYLLDWLSVLKKRRSQNVAARYGEIRTKQIKETRRVHGANV